MNLLFFIPIGAIVGIGVGRLAGDRLPGWCMSAFLIAYCVLLLDIAMPRSFLGLTYLDGQNAYMGLGETLMALCGGVPSVIGLLTGWGLASSKKHSTD